MHTDAILARQILATFGTGLIVVAGDGIGTCGVVRELLKQGVEAYGVDYSVDAVTQCNRYIPGRLLAGSVLAFPFRSECFDTLVGMHCFDHLEPVDVPLALQEAHRVCRRNLLLCVMVGTPREWWENAAFSAGFRKHPAYYVINPYESLEREEGTLTIPLEKIPPPTLRRHPLQDLMAERDLHMDMLRESGSRSDAHAHRYAVAASLVRPGDRVLDAACGLGYGTHILARLSAAGSLLGVDLSEQAVAYATACFGDGDSRVAFRAGDVQNLSTLSDRSLDLVVSFETLEHVPHPERFLAEAARVLKPGGRIMVSVPHRWADASGRDPNPWHLHVYDWEKLSNQLGAHFLIERAYGETAGGGMRLTRHARDFFAFDPRSRPPRDCEWLLAVGMSDPRAGRGLDYIEQMYRADEVPQHLIAFSRDYLNPYLAHAMVSIQWRLGDMQLLRELAQDVHASYPLDSADNAGAVCVLAYQYLADPQADSRAGRELLDQLAAIDRRPPATPHFLRWQISGAYVAGLIGLHLGDHDAALAWFRRCASFDCRDFSPTLGTKTISAAWQAGRLLAQRGDAISAKGELRRGVEIFFGLFRDGREALLGRADCPFDFPYFELSEIAAAVTSCVNLMRQLDMAPGAAPPAVGVENLQQVITSLQVELNRLREAHVACQTQLLEADKHWSIRLFRKTYRFLVKLAHRS